MSEFDVFLSHNSTEKPIVRTLARALQGQNLKVWLDEWELVPGRPWQEALEKIIETTRSAAILVGKDGMGPWERPEMRACLSEFVRRQLPVIPVLLPGAASEPKLPLFLKEFKWIDLREGITDDKIQQLIWAITGVRPDAIVNGPGSTGGNRTKIARRTLLIRVSVSVLATGICWASASIFLNRPQPLVTARLPLGRSTWSFAQAGAYAGMEIRNPKIVEQLSKAFEAMLAKHQEGYVFISQPLSDSVMNPILEVAGLNHSPLSDLNVSSFAVPATGDQLEPIPVDWNGSKVPCRASLTGTFPADTRFVLLFSLAEITWSASEPPDIEVHLVQWVPID
jgi:hypothetical protein